MQTFIVTIKTAVQRITYTAIGKSAIDVHLAAIDQFGICAATVRPLNGAA